MYLLLCLSLLIISIRLFKLLPCLGSAIANFSFRRNIHLLLWCYATDVSLEFPTIYQDFCFVSLVCRFHWKVQRLFCIFCFWKIFGGLRIATWFWSHWCPSKLNFHGNLSPMLYLPWAKRNYWDAYSSGDNWICWYSWMFFLELMVVGLLLSWYVCWFLISCLTYNCSWFSCCLYWRFWKTGFLELSLTCWVITGLRCVFSLVQVKSSNVKKIP